MEYSQHNIPPQAVMLQMITGKIISKCISIIAELGVADHLKDRPEEVATLAKLTATNSDALYRVMRMLSGLGVFVELPGRKFKNTPLSEVLLSNTLGSLREYARFEGTPLHWQITSNMEYSLKTGESSLTKDQPGKSPFEVLAEHSDVEEKFNNAMTGLSQIEGPAIIGCYDFTQFEHIVDVGGGQGVQSIMVAQAAPNAKITVLDFPNVIEGAAPILEAAGLNGRVKVIPGNYFDSIPGPANLIMMKNIVHGEKDADALQLLKNCRKALNKDGKLLVIEALITQSSDSIGSKILDVEMLVGPGGRQRTKEEHEELLKAAGFKLNQIIPAAATSLIEAVKIDFNNVA